MPSKHTIRAAFEYYLSSSSRAKRTKENVRTVQDKIEAAGLLDRELADLKRADVRKFLEGLDLTASTVQVTYIQLKSVLKHYVRDNHVAVVLDLDGLVKKPVGKSEKEQEEQYLTFDQVKELLAMTFPVPELGPDASAAELRNFNKVMDQHKNRILVRDLFCLSCFTGMALSDIMKFNPFVDMTDEWIEYKRSKRGRPCTVPVTPPAQELVNRIDWPVKISRRSIQTHTVYLGQRFGKRLTFHMGRHTAGTVFLELGMEMASVSKILGHSSIKVTETIYAKVTKAKLSREMKKFPMDELRNITPKNNGQAD